MVRLRDMTLEDLPRNIRKKLPLLEYSAINNGKDLLVIDKAEIHLDHGEDDEEVRICYILATDSRKDILYYSETAEEYAKAENGKARICLKAKLNINSFVNIQNIATYISLKPKKTIGWKSLVEKL